MTRIGLGLVSGAALFLAGFAGPTPRDASTNKPSPAQCAAADREDRALPGCAEWSDGEGDSGAEIDSASENAPNRPPAEAFRVCPRDPRCPR